ncbi:MAG TPA: hypothetical protein ENG03_11950, partial [Thioploca sp.]|nr:hypothetical protein [Thioploca sp.]
MSLLLDAFKKVEETKETQQDALTPQPDSTSNLSSVNDEEEDLLFYEITDHDEPKTVDEPAKDSSLKDWDDELLPEFQREDAQLETVSHNSEGTDDLDEPFSPFQN